MKVLVIDDSMYMRASIKIALKKSGYQVIGEAGDGKVAIELIEDLQPDLITLDNILPDMTGFDILNTIKERGIANPKVIMVSALGQHNMIDEAKSLGVLGYVVKPFNVPELVAVMDSVQDSASIS